MDTLDENCWSDLIDYTGLLDDVVTVAVPAELYWNPPLKSHSGYETITASLSVTSSHVNECAEKENCRKRDWKDLCGVATKASRERLRREKLNERFSELSAVLEPGRPVKTDKVAILNDAVRILKRLKSESQEYTEMNESLLEEIKILKAEKNELRQEKLMLKVDKERMEQNLKIAKIPSNGLTPVPASAPVHLSEVNKVPVFPSYGFIPIWQYIPPSARDTSQDHVLRPPAA